MLPCPKDELWGVWRFWIPVQPSRSLWRYICQCISFIRLSTCNFRSFRHQVGNSPLYSYPGPTNVCGKPRKQKIWQKKNKRTRTWKFWVPSPLNPGRGGLWHKFGLWVLCIPTTSCLSVLFLFFNVPAWSDVSHAQTGRPDNVYLALLRWSLLTGAQRWNTATQNYKMWMTYPVLINA